MSLSKEKVFSIMESLLFMSPEPRPFSDFLTLFKGELSSKEVKDFLQEFQNEYNLKSERGLFIEKVATGWQMRTKIENKEYLLKIKPPSVFRLSQPSLEVLAIIAFEQPCSKLKIDEIRGVDSGHLLRNLIEKELIYFSGKSDLPGKPSLYKTSQKFLQVFGLDSLKDLPSQEEIQELLADVKTEASLESVSEELGSNEDSKKIYNEDEKENKRIKDIIKSLPSSVRFLEEKEESKKQDQQTEANPTPPNSSEIKVE